MSTIIILDTGDAVLSSKITSIVAFDRIGKVESAKTCISLKHASPNIQNALIGNLIMGKRYPDFESARKARDKMISDWESSLKNTSGGTP